MKPEFLQARYHTFISTCSMLGISAQKYFSVIIQCDYRRPQGLCPLDFVACLSKNLLPMTIGIK